jgi:hypothetical protein
MLPQPGTCTSQELVPVKNPSQEPVPVRNLYQSGTCTSQEPVPVKNPSQEPVPVRNPSQEHSWLGRATGTEKICYVWVKNAAPTFCVAMACRHIKNPTTRLRSCFHIRDIMQSFFFTASPYLFCALHHADIYFPPHHYLHHTH